MLRFVAAVILSGLPLLSGCASVGTAVSMESISVSRRPWFGVCAGVCPNYDVTVWADGRVLSVRRYSHVPDVVQRFRVPTRDAAQFRSILLPYRPTNAQDVEPTCEHRVSPDEAELVLKVREIEMVWSGPSGPSRLVACDNPALLEALRRALWSVNLYLDGNRRPS